MTAHIESIRTTQALRTLAEQGTAGNGCDCHLNHYQGWDSITDAQWPAAQMQQIADLRNPDLQEPTFAEYHPAGTRYGSADAPIALEWFPANRSTAWRCVRCGLQVLRYTEFGGYYIDQRVRVLRAELIADAPPPAA